MLQQNQAEEAIAGGRSFSETENININGGGGEEKEEQQQEEDEQKSSIFSFKSFLWHGGSVWDAWFSCASNQVLNFLPFPHTLLLDSSLSFFLFFFHIHIYIEFVHY